MSSPELDYSGERKLRTNKVQPDVAYVTDNSTRSDRVIGFHPKSYGDSYENLEIPVLPAGEQKRAKELRDDLLKTESGTV